MASAQRTGVDAIKTQAEQATTGIVSDKLIADIRGQLDSLFLGDSASD